MRRGALVVAGLLWATPLVAIAQQAQPAQHRTASNGVVLDVYGDDFDGQREFAGPSIQQGEATYFAQAVRRNNGEIRWFIGGFVTYRDRTWRDYNGALFRGGDVANFAPRRHDVINCNASQFSSGCTFMEGFVVDLTPADIQNRMEAGSLAIKIVSSTGVQFFITIPESHFAALREAVGPASATPAPQSPAVAPK